MKKDETEWCIRAIKKINDFLHTQDLNDSGKATACILNAMPQKEAMELHKQMIADQINKETKGHLN